MGFIKQTEFKLHNGTSHDDNFFKNLMRDMEEKRRITPNVNKMLNQLTGGSAFIERRKS